MSDLQTIKEFLAKDHGFELGIKRERTLEKYAHMLNRWVGWARVEGEKPKAVIEHVKSLEASMHTKKMVLFALRKYYLLKGNSQAIELLKKNKPKLPRKQRKRFLSYEEVLKIWCGCQDQQERLIFELFTTIGIRLSAMLTLKVSNFHADLNKLYIEGEMIGNKKKEDFYTENLSVRLTERLKEWVKDKQPEDYMFDLGQEDEVGEETKVWRVNNLVKQLGKRVGVKTLGPHVLRHTYGVIHYNAYKDILRTRNAMGQKHVAATEIYAESVPEWEAHAKELIEKGFE